MCKDQESIQSSTHLTQDTNRKVTNSQLDTTNESQEVSPFPAGDHKAHINRRAQRHSKHKTEKKIHIRSTALELNTKAKEIQQENPSGPDKQPKHRAPTISSIDKSLSGNHQRV